MGTLWKGISSPSLDGLRWDFGYHLRTHLIIGENVLSRRFLTVIPVVSGFNLTQS